jgi:hypothetical protein
VIADIRYHLTPTLSPTKWRRGGNVTTALLQKKPFSYLIVFKLLRQVVLVFSTARITKSLRPQMGEKVRMRGL